MKKLALALLIASTLSLGGCAGTLPPTVASIQQLAVSVCGFLPTVATVASIIAAGNPLVATAEAIANAICNAVTPAKVSGRLRAVQPMVGGVVIHGRWVN